MNANMKSMQERMDANRKADQEKADAYWEHMKEAIERQIISLVPIT
jgi:hypothetical protein